MLPRKLISLSTVSGVLIKAVNASDYLTEEVRISLKKYIARQMRSSLREAEARHQDAWKTGVEKGMLSVCQQLPELVTHSQFIIDEVFIWLKEVLRENFPTELISHASLDAFIQTLVKECGVIHHQDLILRIPATLACEMNSISEKYAEFGLKNIHIEPVEKDHAFTLVAGSLVWRFDASKHAIQLAEFYLDPKRQQMISQSQLNSK